MQSGLRAQSPSLPRLVAKMMRMVDLREGYKTPGSHVYLGAVVDDAPLKRVYGAGALWLGSIRLLSSHRSFC